MSLMGGTKFWLVIALAGLTVPMLLLGASLDMTGSSPRFGPEVQRRPPRLVDLGADKCVPCKMMAPVLAGLQKAYAGRMNVEFINVWENGEEAERYGVQWIPTQIFFDATGRELYRHQGFYSRDEILTKWREFGYNFDQ